MAKRRDVTIAIVITVVFIATIGFFGLMLIGFLSTSDGVSFSGFDGNNVGVLDVYGVLDENSGRPVIRQLDKWTNNESIEAVVLHVNSPGGGVSISQEIYDAVGRLKNEKPVVVAMAAVAASGGYYIACGADRIIANQGTLTGSIGVIFQFHTFGDLMDKVGIGTETIKSGEFKDIGSYNREMTKKEELMLRSVVMDTYEQFVEAIADGRGKEKDEVYRLADGSLFTGLQAYNLGLVDTLGGLYEAVQIAAELAGIEGEPNIVRPYKREKMGFFDLVRGLFGGFGEKLGQAAYGPRLLYLYQ
jgi:protease-4